MNLPRQQPARRLLLVLAASFAAAYSAQALYEPAKLQDPARRWAVTLALREGYDSNVFTTPTNAIASWTTTFEPQVLVNIPLEQSFIGLRYTYGAIYYADRPGEAWDTYNTADLLFSHTFTSRLQFDARDQFRQGNEPELVDVPTTGVQDVQRKKGDYLYNNLTGTLAYNLTRRWTAQMGGGWVYWNYDDQSVAEFNDRNIYQGSLSMLYAIDPRTTVGVNYRHFRSEYYSATNDVRNSSSNLGYLSVVRRVNPRLSLQGDGGIQLVDFDNGDQDTAPAAGLGLTYNYGPENTLTAGFRYLLLNSQVSQFRTIETFVMYLQATHQITKKFRTQGNLSYVLGSYENPDPLSGSTLTSAYQDSFSLGATLTYDLTRWCHADLDYIFDDVRATPDLEQTFRRSRVSLGLRLTY